MKAGSFGFRKTSLTPKSPEFHEIGTGSSMILCNSLITHTAPPPHLIFFSPRRPKFTRRFFVSLSSDSSQRVKLAESLQSETLQILEWPAVCSQLAPFTSTSMGLEAARAARIPVGRSLEESRRLLAQTSAALALPRPLDFSGIEDITAIVDSAVAGIMLSIAELCSVKRTLRSARHLVLQLEEFSTDKSLSGRCSPLLEIFQTRSFLMELEEKIEFCLDCKFSVVLDRASEELEHIRSERKRNIENLESLLKQKATWIFQAGGSDRPLVTKRRSRMCIPIRASHRSLLPDGVVLDISSSGATYFMEPEEAIDLNNEEVRLSDSEKIEERAILSLLTSEIVQSNTEIKYLLDRILELDLSSARAAHAHWMRGVCPFFTSENFEDSGSNSLLVDIEGIQHPLLLESSLRKLSDLTRSKLGNSITPYKGNDNANSAVSPVPIDFRIRNSVKVVVISGPNTGGKTASMKTLGLSAIMMKAGLFLPAQNHPQLPWFDFILADIGDQQSLEQNLSTFSGRISRLCNILEVTSEKSLILVDEIGSGTDPSEGMALSASILQYLKDRVNLAIVTTHYADLTRLKERDNRFENAAVEFSRENLQPTYRMLWGSMGESNALSIAKMIGVDEKIIARAWSWVNKLSPEKMQMRRSLLYQSLMEERNKLESQAERAASLHSDVINIYSEIQDEAADLDAREASLMVKERQQIQQELKAVKMEIESIVRQFENQLRTADADEFNSFLKKAELAIASITEAHQPRNDLLFNQTGSSVHVPQLGEQVCVDVLGNKLATVVEAPGEDDMVLVQYGKIRVRVNIRNIRALTNGNSGGTRASVPSSKRQGYQTRNLKGLRNALDMSKSEEVARGPVFQTSKNTVDLRGMRVEEATQYLEMTINSREVNSVLFIIHGMGTGVIKECALQIVKDHPRVAKFEQESPTNYGCTVAYIK